MIVIGIAGGVASGKSLVSKQLETLGAKILDADRVGHEVLREPAVIDALTARWGNCVLDARGELDRSKIAAIVFAPSPDGERELKFLESVSHPRIGQRLHETIDRLKAEGKTPAVVLDAAVMFKSGWDRFCDRIVFVDVPRDIRVSRALSRGWSEEDFAAREARQESIDWKRSRADTVIDNSGTAEETFTQVRQFWQSLGLS